MNVFAIGDLHLALKVPDKSMDIFGDHWIGHWDKIKRSWNEQVSSEDLVLIPGDISWAMHLEDAMVDLDAISELPGKKVLIKGNHDYWWQSLSKINSSVSDDMIFIQNNSFDFGKVGICGSRGWNVPGSSEFSQQDLKIFNREVERLRLSIDSYKGDGEIVVMTHYPPYNDKVEMNDMIKLFMEKNIKRVIFGHIHGLGLKYLKVGEFFGINFECVSSDYLDFNLKML